MSLAFYDSLVQYSKIPLQIKVLLWVQKKHRQNKRCFNPSRVTNDVRTGNLQYLLKFYAFSTNILPISSASSLPSP